MRSNQGRDSWSVGHFERRAILGTRAPVIVNSGCGDIGVAKPLLHLGDVGLVIERIGGGGRCACGEKRDNLPGRFCRRGMTGARGRDRPTANWKLASSEIAARARRKDWRSRRMRA